ncbi:MAG TPA: SDR family oxidoreductase [Methylovirgula sp.]
MSASRRVALITGASGGIGADLARVFARHGHDLVLVARSKERLEALADEIQATGRPRPLVLAHDLAAPGGVDAIAAELLAANVGLDILVNNAGFGLLGDVADLDPAAQMGIVDLNVRALTALCLRFLPDLRAAHGKILNVASVVAFFPGPGMAVYYASKAFVRSFGEALWQELRPFGCTVTTLCPGVTITGFQERAGFTSDLAIMRFGGASAASVAESGYAGLMAGRRIVIPGFANKLLCFFAPRLPAALILPMVASMQKAKAGGH